MIENAIISKWSVKIYLRAIIAIQQKGFIYGNVEQRPNDDQLQIVMKELVE